MTDLLSELQNHLRRIAALHPWYGQLLGEAGIRLGLRESVDLKRLPLLGSALLEKHYYSQPPRHEAGLSVYRTSGTSTGTRKSIYYSEEDEGRYMAAKRSSYAAWLGVNHGIRRAMADLGTGHAASTALAIFESMGCLGEAIPFTAPIQEHVVRLAAFQPQLLYTMPSILEAIAEAAPHPRELGIRKLILVGELASPEWQSRIAARFGLQPGDVLDTYGSIEAGAIAAYDHGLGRYVLAEGMIGESLPAELVDDQLEPLSLDEGVLVITSTQRSLFPVIRYVTYDVVRDFRTIERDGRLLYTFRGITKRIGREFKHGEKISLYDIEEAVYRHATDVSLRVGMADNKLTLYLAGEHLDETKLLAIRSEVENSIDDIGLMIRNGLLGGIQVLAVGSMNRLPAGGVKAKKLYQ
ncbi:AMP-binding protein [Paenibacillus sp. PL2-23]|uniref:AMP-binding protein n=1 Tax=Paenibacillus sp. PL2-23 TaxID=2100729 RepID=UPI0030FAFBD6